MIDAKAFRSITYGLYLISSHSQGQKAGCVVNTFAQVTSEPLQVSVALNKENHTTKIIQESGRYVATCLAEEATMDLIGTFGFHHSHELDKFEGFATEQNGHGIHYVAEQVLARFSVEVTSSLDLGSHILFIGTVDEAEVLAPGKPMSYAYYHEIKGGRTPSRASSFIAELDDPAASGTAGESSATGAKEDKGLEYVWRCTVCGHIEYLDELPEDFVCPVCGVGRDKFERVKNPSA